MRVNGLSTGGRTQAKSHSPNGCGHDESASPRTRLFAGAAPRRCLVEGGRERARRTGGQRARVAGPGDVGELAGGAAHAGDLDVTAEPREGPVERAGEPGHAVLLACDCAATPLIRAV